MAKQRGKKQFNALGIDIFAGGFSIGIRKHFNVLAHLEESMYGVETVRHNMPEIEVRVGCSNWDAEDFAGHVALVYGNPPCAAWSGLGVIPKTSAKRAAIDAGEAKWENDDRVSCTTRLFDAAFAIRPKVIVWESVTQAFFKGREFVKGVVDKCNAEGYSVTVVLFNNGPCGVSQWNRKRMMFIAHTVQLPIVQPDKPVPVVREAWGGRTAVAGLVTNSESASVQHRVALIEQFPGRFGALRRMHTDMYGDRATLRPGFAAQRQPYDAPGYTLAGGAEYYHPIEARLLTVKEQQLIAGYPEKYEFQGCISKQYQQIGQAVLPPVGAWVGENVKRALQVNKRKRRIENKVLDFLKGEEHAL